MADTARTTSAPTPGSRPAAGTARRETTAAALAIGNELLSGKVTDLNLAYIVQELRALGVPLVFAALVPDDYTAIADAVHYASRAGRRRHHDGRSRPDARRHDRSAAIARAFGRNLVREPRIERAIHDWYRQARQRRRPAHGGRARRLGSPRGRRTFLAPHPVEKVLVFPGEPAHLRRKFDAWKGTLRQSPFLLAKVFLDVDEGEIAADLRAVEAAHGVAIGSYPKYDADAAAAGYRVLITIESKQAAPVAAAARDLIARLKPGRLLRAEPGLDVPKLDAPGLAARDPNE